MLTFRSIIVGGYYLVGSRSTLNPLFNCNCSSHTELAKVLPKDWNKLITEGSHTLTSSVSDLTCNRSQPQDKNLTQTQPNMQPIR